MYCTSVNAHAEDLRSKFVAHEGKKELIVTDVGTRYSVDFGKLAAAFTVKIQENVRHSHRPLRYNIFSALTILISGC